VTAIIFMFLSLYFYWQSEDCRLLGHQFNPFRVVGTCFNLAPGLQPGANQSLIPFGVETQYSLKTASSWSKTEVLNQEPDLPTSLFDILNLEF
jgi:hypothetical protein